MAICANQGRMYMGTARQYMEHSDHASMKRSAQPQGPVRSVPGCSCERQAQRKACPAETMCHPESLCADLPLGTAYINPQPYTGLVSGEMALSRGSAFNNFYDPWNPGQYC